MATSCGVMLVATSCWWLRRAGGYVVLGCVGGYVVLWLRRVGGYIVSDRVGGYVVLVATSC